MKKITNILIHMITIGSMVLHKVMPVQREVKFIVIDKMNYSGNIFNTNVL